MISRRRTTGWLALGAFLFYCLVPVLALACGRSPAPAACVATPIHTCACQPDPHALKACCCAIAGPEAACQLGPQPCGGESEPGVLLATRYPLAVLPTRPVALPRPAVPFCRPALPPTGEHGGWLDLSTPPPQLS